MQTVSQSPGRSPFAALSRWWRDLMGNRRGRAELDNLAPDGIDRVARDVGVNAGELRALAGKWPDSADQLTRRIAALSLDAEEIRRSQPSVSNDLKKLCSLCASKGRCEHDLAKDAGNPVWQEYCPNATTLLALQAERAEDSKKSKER
jgi:hypothetical protein